MTMIKREKRLYNRKIKTQLTKAIILTGSKYVCVQCLCGGGASVYMFVNKEMPWVGQTKTH